MGDSGQTLIGRYALFDEIASGGMATVHIGRLVGAAGFSRMVAIKRLHPQFAKDPEFVSMFIDEARLAARIRHPNVVPTLDVVRTDDELFLVMEYVSGETLARLFQQNRQRGQPIAPDIAVAVVAGTLHGLHAAHTARGERGEPLQIVHRDISPQNVMVGIDGVPRVLDFGIAKATVRLQTTRDGQIKGKLAYMAPEQLAGGMVGPATDVYAASLILWEALAGRRLFEAEHEAALLAQVIGGASEPPSSVEAGVPAELDELVMRGLASNPDERFPSAREMARALEKALPPASAADVGLWVEDMATEVLSRRAERIGRIESESEVKTIADLLPASLRGGGQEEAVTMTGRSVLDSQLSSISVARSQTGSAAGRRMRIRVAGLAALALLAGGALALLVLGGDTTEAESEVPRAAASPQGAATLASPTEPEPPPTPTPSVEATGGAAPSNTTVASAEAVSTTTAGSLTRPPWVRPPPPKPPPRPPPPRPNCNPPYTVDAEGIRHIKPECI